MTHGLYHQVKHTLVGCLSFFKAFRRRRDRSCQYRVIETSGLFDSTWYLRQPVLKDIGSASRAPILHYLEEGAAAGLSPGPAFDGVWYLAHYPDVAEAGLNPLLHYLNYGKREGRLPRNNRALAWEHHLWRGAESVMLSRLERLLSAQDASLEESQYSRWALARWWAWQREWTLVQHYLLPDGQLIKFPTHCGPGLLAVEALLAISAQSESCGGVAHECVSDARLQSRQEALLSGVLDILDQHFGLRADTALAHANAVSDPSQRLNWINTPWRKAGLAQVRSDEIDSPLSLDNLRAVVGDAIVASDDTRPLVSVIIPAYNVAETVTTAIRSLFAQRGVRLELLVVDDASVDTTWQILEVLSSECPCHVNLRLFRHTENSGAYSARNTGVSHATGSLITVHDSDDWSHPEKLMRQVAVLEAQSQAVACLSYWVRTTPALHFHHWRVEEGWVYPNISSLMVRRSALETLGGWDNVRVDADTEFHERLIAVFGNEAVVEVLPGVPLAFGRADKASLSQTEVTHLVTRFVGVRQAYMDAARRWHSSVRRVSGGLSLDPKAPWRPFAAPAIICRQALPVRFQHPMDTLQASGLFEAGWYLRTHLDLQDVAIEPLAHYWQVGSREGRDPGPHFSTSGYHHANPDIGEQDPLLHYLTHGRRQGRPPWPLLPGKVTRRESAPSILLCGHQAGTTLFGAERSLLDLLKAMRTLGWNVVVCLPSAMNALYVETLRVHATAVAILPYGWWQQGREPEPVTLRHFRGLMERFEIDAVHVNTVVLEEPMVAARECGVPVIVHVRELPEHDSSLCQTLNADAATVMRRVQDRADLVIANSRVTAGAFQASGHDSPVPPVRVVPNTVDMVSLLALPMRTAPSITVGMLSSNLPKKGLEDVESMARHLALLAPELKVVLYGPRTQALELLLTRQARSLPSDSLVYGGYVDSPAEALAELDIVINLSRFQESFGRTVLEAMAAARPVVSYDWGALTELVEDGVTGYLVPLGDTQGVARCIAALARDPDKRRYLGTAGRQRAKEWFGEVAIATALHEAYLAIPSMTVRDRQTLTQVSSASFGLAHVPGSVSDSLDKKRNST